MSLTPQIKDQIITLLRFGQRDKARQIFKDQLQVSENDAEMLLQAFERENPATPILNPELIGRATSSAGGCVGLVFKALTFIFGFFAIVMIAIGVVSYFVFNSFIEDAARINGTVIELKRQPDSDSYAPVVEYDWNGELKRYESNNFSSPPAYVIDEQVPLLINSQNPDEVVIDSFMDRYMISVMFGGFGVFFLLVSFGFGVASKKVKRNFDNSP